MEMHCSTDSNTFAHAHNGPNANTDYCTFTYGRADSNAIPWLNTNPWHNANTDYHQRNPCPCAIDNNTE